jgi:hypothetical protein
MLVELVSVLGALMLAAAVGISDRRRKQLRACLRCGRVLVLGERTCDCAE